MQIVYKIVDEELINGCIKNNRLAQQRLYERYYGKMMGVCARYASHHEQAAEMLNMGFYKVFKTLDSFKKNGGNLEAWIYRIMVNTAIDYLRSEIRHQHSDIENTIYAEDSSDVIGDMSAEHILELVNALSPAYRMVFNLYAVEGYNHPEIAGMLGISEGTSRSNLAKARANLQEKIIKLNKINVSAYGR